MAAVFVPLGPASGPLSHVLCAKRARVRLALAFSLSLLAHAWLLPGSPLRGAAPVAQPAVSLTAWLEPAAPLSESASGAEGHEPVTDSSARSRPGVPPPARAHAPAASGRAAPAEAPAAHPEQTIPPPPVADDTYYSVRELDVYPAPLAALAFGYPERMRHERVRGRVTLMLLIDATGTVNEATVLSADPPGYFEDAARAALAATRFAPARRNGRAVRSRVTIDVEYDPGMAAGAQR
jgi:protein TonB